MLTLPIAMEEPKNHEQQVIQQIQVEVPEEEAVGRYCNLVIISHSPTEFIMDFINVVPGVKKVPVRARIIMNPVHAKRFLMALQDNIRKYENHFGEISIMPETKLEVIPPFRGGETPQA